MAITNRNSTMYAARHVSFYLQDARNLQGRCVPITFAHTVVSGETGGASANVQDTVNLCVLPAYCTVLHIQWSANAIWASAGTNGTLIIGDSGDADRYVTATEVYTATPGGPIATEGMKRQGLADTGQNYQPTADTIVLLKWQVADPVVGKVIQGFFLVMPGA